METNNTSELFTDLSQEQSETVQGGHYGYYGRGYYRPYYYRPYAYYRPYYRPYYYAPRAYYGGYGCGGW